MIQRTPSSASQLTQRPALARNEAPASLNRPAQTSTREPAVLAQYRGVSSFEAASRTSRTAANVSNVSQVASAASTSAVARAATAPRQDVLEQAERFVVSPQDLQTQLDGDFLSQSEKQELVARLAKNDGKRDVLFGEVYRLSPDQQRKVSDALNGAYKSGALSKDDLLNLADFDQSGLGAERFTQLLALSGDARKVGGSLDALGQALTERAARGGENAENDRLAAAVAFTSSPALQAARLNTPEKRAEAFETLSNALTADRYGNVPGEFGKTFQDQLARSAGQLFSSHAPELVEHFTADGSQDPTTLSRFFAGALLSPDIQDVKLQDGRKVADAVQSSLDGVNQHFTDKIASAPDQNDREQYARQLGRVVAGLGGGADVVLRKHRDALAENAEQREQFAGILGAALGKVAPGGFIAEQAVDALSSKIAELALEAPERPDTSLSSTLFDSYEGGLRDYEEAKNYDGLVTSFDAGYAAARRLVTDDLDLAELE